MDERSAASIERIHVRLRKTRTIRLPEELVSTPHNHRIEVRRQRAASLWITIRRRHQLCECGRFSVGNPPACDVTSLRSRDPVLFRRDSAMRPTVIGSDCLDVREPGVVVPGDDFDVRDRLRVERREEFTAVNEHTHGRLIRARHVSHHSAQNARERGSGSSLGVLSVDHSGISHSFKVRTECDGQLVGSRVFLTREEAEAYVPIVQAWAEEQPGSSRVSIVEIDTTGMFQVPSRPPPRERYTTRIQRTSPEPGWETVHVEVLDDRGLIVGEYDRNYSMLRTFEPFRQRRRDYALISPHYTATSVMDLATGQIVASEQPHVHGFCPVGFYVPDWWDVHTGFTLPGSPGWTDDDEWPTGKFGFVWGCVWGDDNTWKVQLLDLTRIEESILIREERFGYLPIVTHYELDAKRFIHCWIDDGIQHVDFHIARTYDLDTGHVIPDN